MSFEDELPKTLFGRPIKWKAGTFPSMEGVKFVLPCQCLCEACVVACQGWKACTIHGEAKA